MANLFDGVRVVTAAAGNTALAADYNTIQDLLILGLASRSHALETAACKEREDAASAWTYRGLPGMDPPYWQHTTTSPDVIILPLNGLRSAERITELVVLINGTHTTPPAGDNGEIALYRRSVFSITPDAQILVQDLGGADPWDRAGTITRVTVSGLSIDIAINYAYYIYFRSHNEGAGDFIQLYGAKYISQFHKGS